MLHGHNLIRAHMDAAPSLFSSLLPFFFSGKSLQVHRSSCQVSLRRNSRNVWKLSGDTFSSRRQWLCHPLLPRARFLSNTNTGNETLMILSPEKQDARWERGNRVMVLMKWTRINTNFSLFFSSKKRSANKDAAWSTGPAASRGSASECRLPSRVFYLLVPRCLRRGAAVSWCQICSCLDGNPPVRV